MTTKLISLNLGCRLTLLVDGKEVELEYSAVCPSEFMKQPYDVLFYLKDWLKEKLEKDIVQEHIEIAKPKKIKATRAISQETFNKKIKELGYD
jgi:hypothetical protein